jgi:CelD/BcsL family acetyltransferase involved in cellulose biosynthesis
MSDGRWEIISLKGSLGPHAPAWDALNQRFFRSNPMLDSRFVDALLTYFGTGEEKLCILKPLNAPLAMCILKPTGRGVWSTFLPSQAQVGLTLLLDSSEISSLIRQLPGLVGSVDLLCCDSAFGDLTAGGKSAFSKDHALTMNVSLEGDFETYWAERSKQLKKNFRRYERKTEEDQVKPSFRRISSRADIPEAVSRYAELESRGWKGKVGTAVSTQTPQGHFYIDIMNRFAEQDAAFVFELWLGGVLAASRLAVCSPGMIVILKTTYDESLEKYAPGRQLLREVIKNCFEFYPDNVIEFYTDANADQLAWATGQRWIKHINFPRSALSNRIYQLARFVRKVFSTPTTPVDRQAQPSTVEVLSHPDQLPDDVQALFAEASSEYIEFGTTWFKNLVDTVFAESPGVRIYVVRSDGQPVAALAVLVQKATLANRAESLGNYYTALYSPTVGTDATAADMVLLLQSLKRDHAPLVSMRFSPMDPRSSNYRLLRDALRSAGLTPFEFFCFGNWYLTVKGNWEAYLMGRTGTLRSTIKRMTKKFLADGGRLEIFNGSADVERALQAYEQVYAASWKNTEPYPNFVQGLVRASAAKGWLRLGVAWLENKPIAAQIWIVANGNSNIYKVAYDENYKAYTPGTLLTALLMQHSFEVDKVSKVDYLMGDDPYKKTWMSERQERWGIVAYNPRTVVGAILLAREVAGRKLKPWLVKLKNKGPGHEL